jgi:hypothetical protein
MMEEWKVYGGGIENRKLVVMEEKTTKTLRTRVVELYKPNVWAIDGAGNRSGPKDRALTKACREFLKEVTPKKATYASRVQSMYKLIRTYKDLNGGTGDTFVREAFCPWIDEAGVCLGISAMHIWDEVMKNG